MFTHVSRIEGDEKIHISQLYEYVSPYSHSEEEVNMLRKLIEEALLKAKETTETQIVDREGEMCFHVYSSGQLTLMVPWKWYKIIREEGD